MLNLLQAPVSDAIIVLYPVRCPQCGKVACEASGIVKKRCAKCKTWFIVNTEQAQRLDLSE